MKSDSSEKLEKMLAGLKPRQLSEETIQSTLEQTERSSGQAAAAFPRSWWRPIRSLWWLAGAAALVCLFYLAGPDKQPPAPTTPPGVASTVQPGDVASPAPHGPASDVPVTSPPGGTLTDEAVTIGGNGTPMRRLSFHTTESVAWRDASDGTVLVITQPREDIVYIPVHPL